MDKTDFLRLIQMARKNAATERNITSVWQKSGLFPIEPQIVLDKLGLEVPSPDPESPPEVTVTSSIGDTVTVSFTPRNARQVNEIVQQIKAGNPDPTLAEKLGKACNTALAASTLLKSTNDDLVKADERKKDKTKRGQGHWGEARIMNLDVVEERKESLVKAAMEKHMRSWSHLQPSLFEDKKKGRSPVKKKAAIPLTPGPLLPLTPLPPLTFRVPPQPERDHSPAPPSERDETPSPPLERDETPPPEASSQQQQRGSRGRGSGNGSGRGRGSGKGGRGKKEVMKKVVEEVVVEEEVVFSRTGRPIKPKRW